MSALRVRQVDGSSRSSQLSAARMLSARTLATYSSREASRPLQRRSPSALISARWSMPTRRMTLYPFESILPAHGAFVPAPQEDVGDEAQHQEDQDAAHRHHDQGREHARDLELVAGLEDAEREARRCAARAS